MYESKELYSIDFSNVQYYMEIHNTIKKALDFPDYYGGSLDALWDCLRDMEVWSMRFFSNTKLVTVPLSPQ